jgi:hypothetical protein
MPASTAKHHCANDRQERVTRNSACARQRQSAVVYRTAAPATDGEVRLREADSTCQHGNKCFDATWSNGERLRRFSALKPGHHGEDKNKAFTVINSSLNK